MSISATVLPEFDREMATTRTMLERVPDDRAEWTPHVKSWNMGQLASHIGNLPRLGLITMEADELDVSPSSGSNGASTPVFETTENLIRLRHDGAMVVAARWKDHLDPSTRRRSQILHFESYDPSSWPAERVFAT